MRFRDPGVSQPGVRVGHGAFKWVVEFYRPRVGLLSLLLFLGLLGFVWSGGLLDNCRRYFLVAGHGFGLDPAVHVRAAVVASLAAVRLKGIVSVPVKPLVPDGCLHRAPGAIAFLHRVRWGVAATVHTRSGLADGRAVAHKVGNACCKAAKVERT
jgi:hypothetical protein